LLLATGLGLATASAATVKAASVSVSQASVSSNWAGYVASGTDPATGASNLFSTVSGTWVQPKASCSATSTTGSTSSAFWVGLGGNTSTSNGLEQTGTEADCTSTGAARYFAWYELVPAASVRLSFNVTPGDTMSASVTVSGTHVSVLMRNLSQGTSFSKTLTMASPDATSAEWIAEAPSLCVSSSQCRQTALTNFGMVKFTKATATSAGQTGSISDSSWSATPITLQSAGGPGAFGRFATEQSLAEALPSTLTQNGSAFSITWHQLTAQPQPRGGYGYGGGYGY